ncbi:GH25 family lysozyme, partial [Actinobaculum sp. 352]|uniref:GH25 family lysozyme n=1 Tax=Actinobaculum sp. 352 TaxID=2490946 RepID=UPI000FA0E712
WPRAIVPHVDFTITKATGGTSLVIDGWKSMLAGAKRTGVYHYARERGRAGTPVAEAANFIRQAALAPSDALLVLDWEEASGNNLGDADWVLEWMRLVEAALGRRPVFYTYRATLLAHPSLRRVQQAGYPLWYARYPYSAPVGWKSYAQPTDVPYWGRPAIWQYSSAGGVPGWPGALDLNIFYGGAAQWAALTAARVTGKTAVAATTTQHDTRGGVFGDMYTHIIFQVGNAICIANVAAGTWRRMPNTQTFKETITMLQRAKANMVEWRHINTSKSNTVVNPAVFGVEVK